MSWHFSQALVEAYSAVTCLDGEQSAQLNLNPTQRLYSSSDRMMAFCRRSQYGMTCEPLTDDLGRAVLTLFLEAFHAKPIPVQLREKNTADDLWPEMQRVVADVAPRYVFAENVERRAINRAADDLEAMGYDVKCVSLSAKDLGADHVRERHWLLAHADVHSELLSTFNAEVAILPGVCPRVWEAYTGESRVANGLAHRMDRIKAAGNGQVPIVAATAWSILLKQFMLNQPLAPAHIA